MGSKLVGKQCQLLLLKFTMFMNMNHFGSSSCKDMIYTSVRGPMKVMTILLYVLLNYYYKTYELYSRVGMLHIREKAR